MNHSIKVSVIVPVYNVEIYLEKCLDSLVNQTIANEIEIICINDKSPDNSLNILKKYEEKYGNRLIKIIDHQNNTGAAISRNDALKIANGKYVGFVDPDDWVDLDFFEILYNTAIEKNADIVKGNYKKVKNGKYSISKQNDKISKDPIYFCGAGWWSAIYKNDMIKNNSIEFPNIRNSEDDVFLTKCKYFANKIEIVNYVFYYYFRHPDSLTSFSIKTTDAIIEGRKIQLDFLNSVKIDTENYIKYFNRFIEEMLRYYIMTLGNNKNTFSDKIDIVRGIFSLYEICKYKKEYLNNYNYYYNKYMVYNDFEGLNEFLMNYLCNKKYKLFGFINILKIKSKEKYRRIKLFNFITILKIRTEIDKKIYYILGIPVLSINI